MTPSPAAFSFCITTHESVVGSLVIVYWYIRPLIDRPAAGGSMLAIVHCSAIAAALPVCPVVTSDASGKAEKQ